MIDAVTEHVRGLARDRKALLRAAERCINGPLVGFVSRHRGVVHGPVVSGSKCQRCIDIHKRSAS